MAQTPNLKLQQKAQQAQKLGHYAESEQLWKQVLKQQPKSADAYYNLGVSLHRQFKFLEAIQAYSDAVRLSPKYEAAYVNRGLALIQVGNYDDATTSFRAVLTLPNQPNDPASTHALAHYNLAIILKRQGQSSEALSEVEQALKLSPSFKPAQQLREQIKP
jgi:superkiller protein 3